LDRATGGPAGGARKHQGAAAGKLLKDGGETVRMRIGDGWDVDIYKAMILAVEEDSMVLLPA